MINPLESLPADPRLRHQRLAAIITRINEQGLGYWDLTRSLWRIIRKTATNEDYEIVYYGSLLKERELNQARILGPSVKPWKKAKENIRLVGVTPEGERTDIADGNIKRDIDEVGYTLLAQPEQEGSTDGFMATVGLPEIWDHLNFMVEGPQNLDLSAIVLDDLVEMVKVGKVFRHGEWVNNILEGRFGFTVRLTREKLGTMEYFRVGYFDSKGERSVKVQLPRELIDAMRQIDQKAKAS